MAKENDANGSPPLAVVALVGVMMAVFVSTLPTLESLDDIAKVETFTNRVFDEIVSLSTLTWLRTAIAIFMVSVQFREVFLQPGWDQVTNYLPQSKIKRAAIPMHGPRTMMPFTSWSWNVLALSFGINAIIGHCTLSGKTTLPQWVLRCAVVLFEIAAPMSLLVSMVVRYSIWPNMMRSNVDTTPLKRVVTLLWHNANVVLALSEVGLLGGLPVRLSDFSVAPLFGICYVFFTWSMMHRWIPGKGPHFLYFFLDTTLGASWCCKCLLILLAVLSFFYGLFTAAKYAFDHLGAHINQELGMLVHGTLLLIVCSGVCRFRD